MMLRFAIKTRQVIPRIYASRAIRAISVKSYKIFVTTRRISALLCVCRKFIFRQFISERQLGMAEISRRYVRYFDNDLFYLYFDTERREKMKNSFLSPEIYQLYYIVALRE